MVCISASDTVLHTEPLVTACKSMHSDLEMNASRGASSKHVTVSFRDLIIIIKDGWLLGRWQALEIYDD